VLFPLRGDVSSSSLQVSQDCGGRRNDTRRDQRRTGDCFRRRSGVGALENPSQLPCAILRGHVGSAK
jgi:hypothetical protein